VAQHHRKVTRRGIAYVDPRINADDPNAGLRTYSTLHPDSRKNDREWPGSGPGKSKVAVYDFTVDY